MGGYPSFIVGGILALLSVCAPSVAARAACQGGTVQFSDDFSHPSTLWDPVGDSQVLRDGRYVMNVEPNGMAFDWPTTLLFSGTYSVCAKLKLPDDPNGAAGSGVIFWIDPPYNKKGGHNFYMAMISPDGFYWVSRQIDGEKSNVIEPVKSDLVKTGPGAVNEIAVALRDNRGVLIINDRSAGEFAGQPPIQSHAGIFAGAPLEKKYQVEFSNFRVVKP
jgi:hypothetical protein